MTTAATGRGSGARPADPPPAGLAFLLAQVGAHAARLFAQRVAELDLSPAQAGVLRLVAQHPGRNQRALAAQLGVVPSKIVVLVDSLENQGLLERIKSSTDRRQYELHLTESGRHMFRALGRTASQHEAVVTAALDDDERRVLLRLLHRVADQQGLTRGVHPGYQDQYVKSRLGP